MAHGKDWIPLRSSRILISDKLARDKELHHGRTSRSAFFVIFKSFADNLVLVIGGFLRVPFRFATPAPLNPSNGAIYCAASQCSLNLEPLRLVPYDVLIALPLICPSQLQLLEGSATLEGSRRLGLWLNLCFVEAGEIPECPVEFRNLRSGTHLLMPRY